MQKKLHIKKGDTVAVITGNNKGQKGRVLEIIRKTDRAIVEGVNLMKKHTKPNAETPQGGIIEKEAPNNIELQEQIWKIYNNLKWEIIIQNNKEDEILKLWNKLRPYQIEYIEEAVINLVNYN